MSAKVNVPLHTGDAADTSIRAVKAAAVDTPALLVSVIVPFPVFAFGMAAASCAVSAAVSVTEDTPAAMLFVSVTLPNTSLSVCVQVDTGALIVTAAACPIVTAGTLLKDD